MTIPKSPFADVPYYDSNRTNAIGWCSCTHNFFRGCKAVSEACKHCYAASEGGHQVQLRPHSPYRLLVISNGQGGFNWTGTAEETAEEQWVKPFRTRSSWLAFTNSMSDPFHKDLSDAAVLHFFRTLHLASWHTWQVLTKRHKRMARFMARLSLRDGMLQLSPRELPWDERAELPNVWIGVTAENQKRADERLRYLREVKAAVRFVSMEPLLGHVTLGPLIADIDWVIVGGESAAAGKYRPMENAWARALRDECRAAGVPFYFKQRSGERPWLLPKDLDGEFLKQLPLRQKLSAPSPEARRQLIAWARAEYAVVFP